MVNAYVVSSEAYAGKTLTCLVLGTRWRRRELRVGYMKPLGLLSTIVSGQVTDEDALFVAGHLSFEAPPSQLCPILVGPELCHEDPEELRSRVSDAFSAISAGQDVMLLGGLGSAFSRGSTFGLSATSLAELLDAKVVLVSRADSFLAADSVVAAAQVFGERLAGVILNRAPDSERSDLEGEVLPCLAKRGLPILGILPDDPLLSSVSIEEIAKATGGEFLTGASQAESLVEDFVVGAMGVDSALRYFRKAARKCVITGGDRTDVQFAALETPTKCLILTGHLQPSHRVLARADELRVPVLLVRDDTLTTIGTIERMLGKQRVRERTKIDHALAMFESNLALDRLDAALGL
jgi:hypothetical protein